MLCVFVDDYVVFYVVQFEYEWFGVGCEVVFFVEYFGVWQILFVVGVDDFVVDDQ